MDLMNISEVAREIRTSPCTVRRLIKAGKISYRQLGGRKFFLKEDLEAFLKNCAIPAADPHKEAVL